MLEIDGKQVDLTRPETWGTAIQLKPGGYVEQRKDGVTTLVERVQDCATKNQPLKGQP
jgi:hypothetical protein